MRKSHFTPLARSTGPVTPSAIASSALRIPTPFVRPTQMRFSVSSVSYSSIFWSKSLQKRFTSCSNSSYVSYCNPPMRNACVVSRAPQYFSKIFRISSRSRKAVKKRRQRADIQRVRPQPQQVAGDPLQLRQNRAHHTRARRRFGAQQFFHRLAVAQPVRNRRHVIHAVHVRRKLLVAAMLRDFLHAAMQVADDALRPDHALAIQFQLHAQHAVRRRMLRPHVQNDFVRAQHRGVDAIHRRNRFYRVLVAHSLVAGLRCYCPLSIPRFSRTQSVSCFKMS